ncbi:MAG: PhaM family polyhydroxyalkanoate granule multifunctional regulatory protein [Ramlibacter sp.]
MSDNPNLGFGKFVPGFDFLQNIAKGGQQAMPQMPSLSSWVAPTLNVEELDKRIGEMKAVHFWLEQNSKALAATIQALEVQKMTLATLKGMNLKMGEVANALQLQATDAIAGMQKAGETAAAALRGGNGKKADDGKKAAGDGKSAGLVDPLQWWGALTQQFQQIAAGALADAARHTTAAGEGAARGAPAPAADAKPPGAGTHAAPARKAAAKAKPARKTAARRTAMR